MFIPLSSGLLHPPADAARRRMQHSCRPMPPGTKPRTPGRTSSCTDSCSQRRRPAIRATQRTVSFSVTARCLQAPSSARQGAPAPALTVVRNGAGRPSGRRSVPSHSALPPGALGHQAAHARAHQLLHHPSRRGPAAMRPTCSAPPHPALPPDASTCTKQRTPRRKFLPKAF